MMQKRSMMSGQCGLADASAKPTLGFSSAGQGVREGGRRVGTTGKCAAMELRERLTDLFC